MKGIMCDLRAYKEWKEVFDEDVSKVWKEESLPVLKKLSMMLFSIKKEMKKIENQLDNDVLNVKKNILEAERKQKVLSKCQSAVLNNNKENVQARTTETRYLQSKNIPVDSPEMFQNIKLPLSVSSDSGSIIISDGDDTATLINTSPEIKKKKRVHALHKSSQRGHKLWDTKSSTMTFLGDQKKDNCFEIQDEKRQVSSVDDKSMDFFKGLIHHSYQLGDANKKGIIQIEKNSTCDIKSKKGDLVSTPVRSDCDPDMSIVQCTPVSIALPKRREKMPSYLSKKKSKRENGITLTQLFARNEKIKKEIERSNRIQETVYDSDETYFNPSSSSKASDTGSVMSITRMVSYLNTNSPLKQKDKTKSAKVTQDALIVIPDTQEVASIIGGIGYDDFQDDDDDDNSLNSAIVEDEQENEETKMEAELPQNLNDLLAKAQNVPEHQLEAADVVRGKARQKLPGWSCKDCERFYLNQGLNTEEILALSKCSKHRGYYKPREDTVPGFWDMNITTQDTENT